ncbi:flagellar brake protein [Natronospira sp.]|uniref:flagellar brake protein n=1 Tax=Natronospira sp. TaxID=2024970 RepID=UPI003872D572
MTVGSDHNAPAEETLEKRPARIRQLLLRLRDQRPLLTVSFRGRSDQFGSMLLGVDIERGELSFDELTPTDGDRLVRLQQSFQVTGQLDGAEVRFPVQVRRREEQDGFITYIAPIPDSLRYLQRRRAFRVEVPARPECPVVMSNSDGDWFEGVLVDVSISGIGFRVNKQLADGLERGSRCDCHIDFPDATVETRVEIRFNEPVRDKPFNRLGARFLRLEASDRRQIERFVFQLQRRQLKNEL